MIKHRTPLLQRILPFWETASVPEALFALVVLAAPLLIGGVHAPTRIGLAVAAFAAFAWTAWRVRRRGARMRMGPFGVALLLAMAWAFVQWLPLPTAVVEVLAPAGAEARRLAAEALSTSAPAWQPLTLDAGYTALAVVSLAGLASVFLAGLNLRTDEALRDRLIVYVEVAAVVVLALGLLHRLLGLETIYGVYTASVSLADRPLITPFVNPNHAGALMMMVALVALGRWLTAIRGGRYHLFVAAALVMGVVATLSRANTLLLALGLLLIGANLFLRRRTDPSARTRYVRVLLGVACIVFLTVVFVGPDRWTAELMTIADLETGDMGLVQLCWATGGAVVGGHLWLGTGAGAFAVAAPTSMPNWDAGLISYAHNGVLQIIAELGLPVAAVIFGLVALGALWLLRASWSHPARFAAVVALLLVAVQNMVDFSLWLPGVAIPFMVVLAVVAGEAWPSRRLARLAWRWPFAASLVVGGVLVVSGLYAWDEQPGAWEAEMRQELDAGKPGRVDLPQTLLRHAHDYYAFRLGAAVAVQQGDVELSARLLARAGELAPTEPETLIVRAEAALARDDISTGLDLLERLAAIDSRSLRRATRLVLAHRDHRALLDGWFDPRERLGAATGARVGAERVEHASQALGSLGELAAAEGLLRWGIGRFPEALALYERLGGRWHGQPSKGAELDRLSVDLLVRAGEAGREDEPGWARAGYLLQGHVQLRKGAALEAWHLYLEAAELDPERAGQPLMAAGQAALELGDLERLDEALERLESAQLTSVWLRGKHRWLKSREREARGDIPGAIREMQKALRHLEFVAAYHDRLAQLFTLEGDATSAQRARDRAAEIREKERSQRELDLR